MSIHPNAILMVVLTPDDLPMKTMRAIQEKYHAGSELDDDVTITIGEKEYHTLVMEDDYEEGFQISGKPGNLIFLDMVTYGYGDVVTWADLENQKNQLEEWAKSVCDEFHCNYEIQMTANYW